MASSIDATKPADNSPALTSDLRANLLAAKTEIEALQTANTGTNTGDETGARIATLLHASSAKTTLVDADEVNGTDSAASFGLIRTTWANVRVYLANYFALKGATTSSGLTMSTNKLLGRNTASTGAIEEITLGTNLSFSGTTLNATGGTGDFKADGTVAMTAKIRCPITGTLSAFIGSSGTTSSDLAIWSDLSKFYFLNGNNTSYVPVNTGVLTVSGTVTSSIGFVHGSTGGLASNLNGGWALLNSSLTAYVNGTAAKLFVTGATLTYDTAWERGASGRMDATDGAGNLRDVRVRNVLAGGGNGSYVQTPSMTVANLASAATAGAGARAFVTDATATTFLSTVAGGGANKVPVVSDGTNWLIG